MKKSTKHKLDTFVKDLINEYSNSNDDEYVIVTYKQVFDMYHQDKTKKYPFHGYITRNDDYKIDRGQFFICLGDVVSNKNKYIKQLKQTSIPKSIKQDPVQLAKELLKEDDVLSNNNHPLYDDYTVTQQDIDESFGGNSIDDIMALL